MKNIELYKNFQLYEKLAPLYEMTVYHGTNKDFIFFDTNLTVDGGIHFGTREQAIMRSSKYLFEVKIEIQRPIRCTDTGGAWREKIAAAKARKADGIVYLNKYEGIPYERFKQLEQKGIKGYELDELPDSKFKKLVPEAEDSYILFDSKYITILNRYKL